jgi:hypothetical protein
VWFDGYVQTRHDFQAIYSMRAIFQLLIVPILAVVGIIVVFSYTTAMLAAVLSTETLRSKQQI